MLDIVVCCHRVQWFAAIRFLLPARPDRTAKILTGEIWQTSTLGVRTKPQAAVAAAVAIESFCWPGDSRGRGCSHVSTDCEAGGIRRL